MDIGVVRRELVAAALAVTFSASSPLMSMMLEKRAFVSLVVACLSIPVVSIRASRNGGVEARGERRIAIDGTRFQPHDLTVPLGRVVIWRNHDPFPHNVTAVAAGGFRSGELTPDAEWRWRPTTTGTFEYTCTLHPGMKGVVRVR
jgi:plastocyanin